MTIIKFTPLGLANRAEADGAIVCFVLRNQCATLEDLCRQEGACEWALYDRKVGGAPGPHHGPGACGWGGGGAAAAQVASMGSRWRRPVKGV
jgi:hypothetical protein